MADVSAIVCTFYNTARLGLAYVEQSPVGAQCTTVKVQKFICLFDLGATCFAGWQVYCQLKEKYKSFYEENQGVFICCALFGAGALLANAYLFVKFKNHALTPKIDLSEVLSNVIPAGELNNITATWGRPLTQDLIQGLFFTRLVLTLGLAALKSKPYQNIFNAALQGLTLFKISQLQWIQFNRTFQNPFQTITGCKITEGGTLETFQKAVNKLEMTCFVRAFSLETPYLQATMKSIYEYSNQVFQGSRWSRYWLVGLGIKENYVNQTSSRSLWTEFWRYCIANGEGRAEVGYDAVLIKRLLPLTSYEQPILSQIQALLFHQDKKWQLFQWMTLTPGKLVDYSKQVWVNIKN